MVGVTNEIIERVARALFDADKRKPPELASWNNGWVAYVSAARAAIEAMREPTEAMKFACHRAVVSELDEPEAVGWRAMIDAALRD